MEKLIIGIGNTSRGDDALGWMAAQALCEQDAHLHLVYQLQIEDAELISGYKEVLIVDASVSTHAKGYSYRRCLPEDDRSFTTHSVSPECMLFLCNLHFDAFPVVHILEVTGYGWELGEDITREAEENLQKALQFMESVSPHPAHT
jgi:hydrogenase maturation protease